MQVSDPMQPMESMGPGQLIMPSPQSMGGICGQKNGHSAPSATQDSGPIQPMVSIGPAQFIMPSPHSMGGMWTEEWALVSLRNADLRHHAAHGVDVARAGCHTCPAVHGQHRRAWCWHSQSSGEKGKEQERHLDANSPM